MNEQQKRSTWFWLLIGGGLFAVVLAVIVGLAFAIVRATGDSDISSFGSDKIGVIDIDGDILCAETPISQLRKYATTARSGPSSCTSIRPAEARPPPRRSTKRSSGSATKRRSPSSPASRARAQAALIILPPEPAKSSPTAPASSVASASSWSTPTTGTC